MDILISAAIFEFEIYIIVQMSEINGFQWIFLRRLDNNSPLTQVRGKSNVKTSEKTRVSNKSSKNDENPQRKCIV